MMPHGRQQAIAEVLQARGAHALCARCQGATFDVVGEAKSPVSLDGSLGCPVVVTACATCGWVCLHALGPLGLASFTPLEDRG